MNKKNTDKYLIEHGIKPSYQRLKIFEYLLEHETHPTVDEIYKYLSNEIPTLSKTTVYNTLNLFIEKGIVTVITIEEKETRYDANTSMHGHFKCRQCGNVYDFHTDLSYMDSDSLDGFKVEEKHIYFKGICKKCLKD
ncbi:Fur family transcriptional regulator [Clostridiisalibacter paucivorans]|uniref:Fur family transcriptional regulator n=1 Tax=Clostridiisalibacter paucivorans TaxID=408753 RepID=UPI00047D580B|nr:Fur family transcriptional regulator [Clostridiisalibacter paucivorans]